MVDTLNAMDDPDNLDEVDSALFLLLWQQPTDRALIGWCPDPGIAGALSTYNDEERLRWWRVNCFDYSDHDD